MLSLMKPCEPPAHSFWHLVSGVATLSAAWAGIVFLAYRFA